MNMTLNYVAKRFRQIEGLFDIEHPPPSDAKINRMNENCAELAKLLAELTEHVEQLEKKSQCPTT